MTEPSKDTTEEKNKSGRPLIVLTEEQLIEVGTLAQYLTTEQIADHLGIARSSFWNLIERDERVEKAYKKAKAKSIAMVSQTLVKKALAGDTTSAIFYLKTQAGWKETKAHEHSGPNGGPIPTQKTALKDMPKEQADAQIKEYLDVEPETNDAAD